MITDHDALSIPHGLNSGTGDIDQLVKRWNYRAVIDVASDRENYFNGNIKYLFEYACIRNSRCSTLSAIHERNVPHCVPVVLAEATIDKTARKIWHLFDKCLGRNPCVIASWDKKLVLVKNVELLDEREIFIPTKLTVGLQIEKKLIKGWRDPIGESRLYGFIKPCLGFTEGELQPPSFLIGSGKRRHDFPIGVIESGAKVVDGITTNDCCPVYDQSSEVKE